MSVFAAIILPAGLNLTVPQLLDIANSCGSGMIIEGLAPIYAPYVSEGDLPAVFTETITEACDHVVLDLGGGETYEYDDCYIVSDERVVEPNAECVVTVLDGIFGEGGW